MELPSQVKYETGEGAGEQHGGISECGTSVNDTRALLALVIGHNEECRGNFLLLMPMTLDIEPCSSISKAFTKSLLDLFQCPFKHKCKGSYMYVCVHL